MTTPGIDPTNHLAEQALRFVIIDRSFDREALDRRLTQGTRSVRGRRWCQRIWTAVVRPGGSRRAATCRPQGRSLFEYLCSAIHAFFDGHPAPSLLPSGP